MNNLLISLPTELCVLGNPSHDSIIEAHNDVEAANAWVIAKGGRSQSTHDAYVREATRLLVWLSVQGIQLADVTVKNVHQYFTFLADPPENWVRPKSVKKNQRLLPTQLLAGKLSIKSINYSRTVLSQMFSYLQAAGYIKRNAFLLSIKPPVVVEKTPKKLLDVDAWKWLWNWLCDLPTKTPLERAHAARCRWLFILLYSTGLRRAEVANSLMGDFVKTDGKWFLRVIGKGNKERLVTISDLLVEELKRYRRSLGLPLEPSPSEEAPLVGSVNRNKGKNDRLLPSLKKDSDEDEIKALRGKRNKLCLTPRAIALIIETVGELATASCTDEHIRVQIEKMTTHWMRHTNGSHRLMSGALTETTQDELGHADIRTTRIYTHTADTQRRDDAEKLSNFHASNTQSK